MSRQFLQVDVFGDGPFMGNPVAVVLDADELTPDEMRRFSVWTNLSECTFVAPPVSPTADYSVRIFSLNTELPFAGHPTLGTARAWLDSGNTPKTQGVIVQECGAGLVPVRIDDDLLAFAAPERIRSGAVSPEYLADVIEILGVEEHRVVDAEWLDNGPGWVGVLLDSARTVLSLKPDVSAHPGRWDIGVIGPSPDATAPGFELRAFFTEGDEPLREDPVTGSLNAAAAQWLVATGRASVPYVAKQGTAMGRRGRIHVSEDAQGIWIGGATHIAVRGNVEL